MKLLDQGNKKGALTYTVFAVFISVFLFGIFIIVAGVFYPQVDKANCGDTLTLEKDRVKEVYVLESCVENK